MAEPENVDTEIEDIEEENKVAYKIPAEKTVQELLSADAEDESLQKYKKNLLGDMSGIGGGEGKVKVTVKKMAIITEGKEQEIDLQNEKEKEKMHFIATEEAEYRIKLTFEVKNQIVCGLKLVNKFSKSGIAKVLGHGKQCIMIGSFPPSPDATYQTGVDTFPSGKGQFKVRSKFEDDDGNTHCEWVWTFELKKKKE